LNLEEKIAEVGSRLEQADLSYGHGTDNARDESAWMVLKVLGYDLGREVLDGRINWHRRLSDADLAAVDGMVDQRITRRAPLAYLINETWFAGNRFYIDERAMVPRSYLGEWIPDAFRPWVDPGNIRSVLDLCTGCGCIAISCARAFPRSRVVASDLSEAALEVARKNIEVYGLQERVSLRHCDGFQGIHERFDMIVCNPPYVSDARMQGLPEEYRKEPETAFRGGKDGLDFILPMLRQSVHHLTENGTLFVEAGSASHALEARFPEIPFTWLSTEYDEMVVFCLSAGELRQYREVLVAYGDEN